MDKLKIVLKALIFFVIGIFIFQILTLIFVPKWLGRIDPATPRWQEFYSQEKDSIDVALVGASDVGRGLSPITLWKEYGITSFNLGTSNQTMGFAYYVIKEAIEQQNVGMVVLDMDALFVKVNAPEGEYRKLFDNIKLGKNKIEAIQDPGLEIEDKMSYIVPLMRFHSRWDKLERQDFKINKKYEKFNSYKGMAISNNVKPYIDKKKYMENKGETEKIPEKNQRYVEEIVKLCKERKIKLLMIEIPSASSWSYARGKATSELAKEHEIEFIDMNSLQEEMQFNWLTDTADKGNHLNVIGAEKVSRYLGKILSEKYECTDHRNDYRYLNWEEETSRYERDKDKLNIKKIKK